MRTAKAPFHFRSIFPCQQCCASHIRIPLEPTSEWLIARRIMHERPCFADPQKCTGQKRFEAKLQHQLVPLESMLCWNPVTPVAFFCSCFKSDMHIDSDTSATSAQLAFVPPPWPQARLCLMIANKQRMHCRHPRIGDGILSEKGP